LGLAVPLSRFTSRVGGGSTFFVRHRSHIDFMYIGPQSKSGKIAAGIILILAGGAGVAFDIYSSPVSRTDASWTYLLGWVVSILCLFQGIKSVFYELRHDA
jgi:hypothetical protein